MFFCFSKKNNASDGGARGLRGPALSPHYEELDGGPSQWLDQGFVLREKEFSTAITSFDWSIYKGCYVALFCSTDAILPAWASLLITAQLNQVANQIVWGSLQDLEHQLCVKAIDELDLSFFESKPVTLKGCSDKQIPESAFVYLTQKLQPVVKSPFYGEACSSVPLRDLPQIVAI